LQGHASGFSKEKMKEIMARGVVLESTYWKKKEHACLIPM